MIKRMSELPVSMPAFIALCDAALERGLQVLLFASLTIRDAPAGGEYRDLDLLAVVAPGETHPVASAHVDGDLEMAAGVVLRRLLAIGGGA